MPDFDHTLAMRLGGWHPRYAVVLATASREGVAAALVDTNGDGADVDLDQYARGADGRWVEASSGNCDDTGAFATGSMGVAWGKARPGSLVRVGFGGATYDVETSEHGWWMFVAPSDTGDVPKAVAVGDAAG